MKKSVLFIFMMMAVSLTASAQNFALIDMEYILGNIPAFASANEQLNQASARWQNEVEASMEQAQELYTNYQSQANSLSDQQRSQREEEIIAKEREAAELRRKYFGPDGELNKLQESLIKPLQDQIYIAVKEISERSNYSLVIDRASAQSVIFASPRIDISDEVLARLGYSN